MTIPRRLVAVAWPNLRRRARDEHLTCTGRRLRPLAGAWTRSGQGDDEHYSGLVDRPAALSAVNAGPGVTNPEKWLYSWMCGSWAAWEAGFGACEVQHREGDEGFGSVEAERDSGDQSDLGVD